MFCFLICVKCQTLTNVSLQATTTTRLHNFVPSVCVVSSNFQRSRLQTHQSPLDLRVIARVPSMVFAEMQCESRVIDKAVGGREHRPSVQQRTATNDAAPAAGRRDGHCPWPLAGQGPQAMGDFAGGLHSG